MTYLDIILQTILDIIFFKNIFQTFYFSIFIYLIFILSKRIQSKKIESKIIVFLRFIILLLIIPLFINNLFRFNSSIERKQNIGVVMDNSLSVKRILTNNNIDIIKYINIIEDWADDNDVKITLFDLDTVINKNSLLFNKESTSFDFIQDIKTKNNVDQLIIITDGVVNSGIINTDYYTNSNLPINIIGVGDEQISNDIGFNEIQIETNNDSINILSSINVKSKNDVLIKYEVFSENKLIFLDTIQTIKGLYNFDKSIRLSSDLIGNKIINKIESLNFIDLQKSNNIWNTNFNKIKEKSILLLTGKLTYNTKFIKSNISQISNINIFHYNIFNEDFDYNKVINKNFDYVILDNFPNNDFQFNLFNLLQEEKQKYLFVEGLGYTNDYLVKILNHKNEGRFYYNTNFNQKELVLNNNIKIDNIYTDFNLFCNDCEGVDNINYYTNESIAEISFENQTFFLIPNLSELSFYYKNKYGIKYIDDYFQYIINKNLNNNYLLNFNINKNNYSISEKINFSLHETVTFEIKQKSVIVKNIDNLDVDTLVYDKDIDLYFSKKGSYEIYFSFLGTNSVVINSNKEDIVISEDNIELETNYQNIEFLENISKASGGFYFNFDIANLTFLRQIDSSFIKEDYKEIYKALDVFIKNKIYFYLIILFCLEIYLRKRIGLL